MLLSQLCEATVECKSVKVLILKPNFYDVLLLFYFLTLISIKIKNILWDQFFDPFYIPFKGCSLQVYSSSGNSTLWVCRWPSTCGVVHARAENNRRPALCLLQVHSGFFEFNFFGLPWVEHLSKNTRY